MAITSFNSSQDKLYFPFILVKQISDKNVKFIASHKILTLKYSKGKKGVMSIMRCHINICILTWPTRYWIDRPMGNVFALKVYDTGSIPVQCLIVGLSEK